MSMNTQTLVEIGLNESQAKAYLALIRGGKLTPPQLAERIQVTRTNAYELLDQLEALGLAQKSEEGKKLSYAPGHPNALDELIRKRRENVFEQEGRINAMMPQLLSYFYTYSDQPGIRFLQGREGIAEVYKDILRTKEDNYLIRTTSDDKFLGLAFFDEFRKQRAKIGINTYALTPDVPEVNHDPSKDASNLFHRTWIKPYEYTAPVEIDIYGDKVAFISFGNEAMATIMQSPQIAEAMRQMWRMVQRGC